MTAGIMVKVELINDRLNNAVSCSSKTLFRQFDACGYAWCGAPHHIQSQMLSPAVQELYINRDLLEIPPTFATSQGTEVILWCNIRSWKQNAETFVQTYCCHAMWKMAADCSIFVVILCIPFFWILPSTMTVNLNYITSQWIIDYYI